jgi:CheY-like chemotaxis protein
MPGLRLLVVEDHEDTAEILATLLQMRGHAVKVARCVRDALALARSESFDLLVSDVGLPDATGYDLMRAIHEQTPIKGISVSGWGRAEDIERSRQAGFSEHLIKPIGLSKLEQAIARVRPTG